MDFCTLCSVVIVTIILGVTLFLLLVSVLALISRINLLVRKMDEITQIFQQADEDMERVATRVMSPESVEESD